MSPLQVVILVVIFFVASSIGVVTGSTSLVTVPAMLQFHIEPRNAIATNMFALTLMSMGASVSLLRNDLLDRKRLGPLTGFTIVGSVLGAILLIVLPVRATIVIVPSAMICVALFSAIYRSSVAVRGC